MMLKVGNLGMVGEASRLPRIEFFLKNRGLFPFYFHVLNLIGDLKSACVGIR
jgi:hypothetical protein